MSRVDACIGVPEGTKTEGQVALQIIQGGPHAVCRFEIRPEDFRKSWEEAFVWLADSEYECDDRPCYEIYRNDARQHPEGKWIVDICMPLKIGR
ncbi:MAG: GyrI-like domain-containing protein [Desulfobacteraceae bacterium]|nr:GyrI-like domain-containing protein [Desulfobacteraceae bacterium]